MITYPIFDLHCDLLSYLAEVNRATIFDTANIGCALPFLKEGNVKLQVMAIYAPTKNGSSEFGLKQAKIFKGLLESHPTEFQHVKSYNDALSAVSSDKIGVIGAIENASAFCEENESLDNGFKKLEALFDLFEKTMYITFTHKDENRFGGGNLSPVGLKDDGRVLLEYLSGKKVAVDFSHTSDSLANDIFNHIEKKGLKIPILASHSNFRVVHIDSAERNLPDEITKEISTRDGLIGINFIKDFIGHSGPSDIYKHILYGFENGYENNLAFGADFFWAPPGYKSDTGKFFYDEHSNAAKYPEILQDLKDKLPIENFRNLSYLNALEFIKFSWSM